MGTSSANLDRRLLRGVSTAALAALLPAAALAQEPAPAASPDQARAADVVDPSNPGAAEKQAGDPGEIVVTGSRIQRAGFSAPTPTTVLGDIELRQGNRPSIAEVLDDQPQFRASSTPNTTSGNTASSVATADLRGLGAVRTLTLLNGHRFSGAADLNSVPQSIIKRVDVVTGGASAAWGSGAVAGVVNIILDDDLKGLSGTLNTGVADRGDAQRYGGNLTYGTRLLDDRLHFMAAAEYIKEKGIFNRNDDSRPNLDSALFQQSNGQLLLTQHVNYTIINTGGVIYPAGGGARAALQVFQPNGSLAPLQLGSLTAGAFTVGGNGQNLYDFVAIRAPFQRANGFARLSYDVADNLKLWVNGSYSRTWSTYAFFPETPIVTISADNAFLTTTARSQLAALGATYPILVGRILTDVGPQRYMNYHYVRRNLEGTAGFDGSFGSNWHYTGYYDHGELRNTQVLSNQRITTNFNRGVDSILVNGVPTCRVNAVTVTDPSCQPINLLGQGNISAAAVGYGFGAAEQIFTNKLDAAGVSLNGQPFRTWAGPLDVAVGGEWRREAQVTNYIDPGSNANAYGTLNFSPLNGHFTVKEAFGEINVPILDVENVVHAELNGAGRYSDYSTSGGIWTWKYGGTVRVLKDILLRGTYSRDIRSPNLTEYFTTRGVNIANAADPYVRTNGNPTTQANVVSYTGGNPNLRPEIAHTLTLGGSYSPSFFKGFSASVDYYRIKIGGAIINLALNDLLTACYATSPNDPTCNGVIARNAPINGATIGSIASINRTYLNLAGYKTTGFDIEASYVLPVDRLFTGMPGTLRFRALANRVNHLYINNGVTTIDRAGDVGDTPTFTAPHWRGTGSINYQGEKLGVDVRVRYIGGGNYDSQQNIVNNHISSRTYVDIGLQYKVGPLTLFGTINNAFDRDPPPTQYGSQYFDPIGRYYSGGVKVNF